MTTVQSVTGPLDAGDLGTTLIHEHLLARDEAVAFQFPQLGTTAGDPVRAVPTDGAEQVAIDCAKAVMERGVRTICDPSAMFLGRDVLFMRRVAEATGLQVIPATGIYTYDHLPTALMTRDADAIADLFVHDIEEGIQGTDIKAAFIKCAADEPGLTENVEKVHRAAARASVRTGAPIMAHSRPLSGTGPKQIEIFEEEDVDLRRLQIAHTGDSADLDYIEQILAKGVYAGLDRFGLEMYLPFDQRIPTALALLERGHAERLFISADYCATIDWFAPEVEQQMLDAGMAVDWSMNIVHDKVLPALRDGGMTEDQERTMLVENPVRWLTGSG
jgi:phosphotriesterase-related protein